MRRLGTTTRVRKCDACGKTDLAQTVVFADGAKKVHLGSECAKRHNPRKKLSEKQERELDARLRAQGADEFRRRWREAERAGVFKDPGDARWTAWRDEVEKMSHDIRSDRQRYLREHFGDREAEFQFGIGFAAKRALDDIGNWPRPQRKLTEEQIEEEKREAHEWVLRHTNRADSARDQTWRFHKRLLNARNSPSALRKLGFTRDEVDRMIAGMNSGSSKADVLHSIGRDRQRNTALVVPPPHSH